MIGQTTEQRGNGWSDRQQNEGATEDRTDDRTQGEQMIGQTAEQRRDRRSDRRPNTGATAERTERDTVCQIIDLKKNKNKKNQIFPEIAIS